MKRWIGLFLALMVFMSQSAAAQQDGSTVSDVEHIIFDLPATAMCKKQIRPSSTSIFVGPYCRRAKDALLYDDPSPVYELSSRPPYGVRMISPMQDGGYMINNQTNEWFFQAADGKIYRQSLNGGPQTYVTTPFIQVAQPKDTASSKPCLNAEQPASLAKPESTVKASDMRLNATGHYLTYLTYYGTYDDGCDVYDHHNLHSVNLATGSDVIINTPTQSTKYVGEPFWVQTPSGYILYKNEVDPEIYIVNPHDNTRVIASTIQSWELWSSFLLPNGEELIFTKGRTVYRLHLSTNVATPITTFDAGESYRLHRSNDPEWVLAEAYTGFIHVNLLTGEQRPVLVSATPKKKILFNDVTGFYYQDQSDLKRYDFAAQQITTVVTDTDPNFDYHYQINHSGTAALISVTKLDSNFIGCTHQFQYLNFNTTIPDIIYTHSNTLTCIEKSMDRSYPGYYNLTDAVLFSPDDRVIVFNEYMNTNPQTIRYHALIPEQAPLWYTYAPTVIQ